jgi:hypothetical protein
MPSSATLRPNSRSARIVDGRSWIRLPQGGAKRVRPSRMTGRSNERSSKHRPSILIGGHAPPLLDPQPAHIRDRLTIDELRFAVACRLWRDKLLIFELTERHLFLFPITNLLLLCHRPGLAPHNRCRITSPRLGEFAPALSPLTSDLRIDSGATPAPSALRATLAAKRLPVQNGYKPSPFFRPLTSGLPLPLLTAHCSRAMFDVQRSTFDALNQRTCAVQSSDFKFGRLNPTVEWVRRRRGDRGDCCVSGRSFRNLDSSHNTPRALDPSA